MRLYMCFQMFLSFSPCKCTYMKVLLSICYWNSWKIIYFFTLTFSFSESCRVLGVTLAKINIFMVRSYEDLVFLGSIFDSRFWLVSFTKPSMNCFSVEALTYILRDTFYFICTRRAIKSPNKIFTLPIW